jgi:hypothetical protein
MGRNRVRRCEKWAENGDFYIKMLKKWRFGGENCGFWVKMCERSMFLWENGPKIGFFVYKWCRNGGW